MVAPDRETPGKVVLGDVALQPRLAQARADFGDRAFRDDCSNPSAMFDAIESFASDI